MLVAYIGDDDKVRELITTKPPQPHKLPLLGRFLAPWTTGTPAQPPSAQEPFGVPAEYGTFLDRARWGTLQYVIVQVWATVL